FPDRFLGSTELSFRFAASEILHFLEIRVVSEIFASGFVVGDGLEEVFNVDHKEARVKCQVSSVGREQREAGARDVPARSNFDSARVAVFLSGAGWGWGRCCGPGRPALRTSVKLGVDESGLFIFA